MSISYNSSIVTNGLVLCLDAGSPRSYPGTGTNWFDVSGNNNTGALTNGPAYTNIGANSYFTFDGVNDYSLSPGLQTFGNNMTWEAWVYCTQNLTTYNMFMGRYLPYFSFYAGSTLYFSNLIAGTQQTIYTASNLSLNTWYMATFTTSFDGTNTTMKIFTNGAETATGTYSGSQGNYPYGFMVGDGNNAGSSWYPFPGRIGAVKVYNRTLTAGEITQNFNALRGRYGI
jgi:hypothetical protein